MSNYAIIIKDANTKICEHDARYLAKFLKEQNSVFPCVRLLEVSKVSELLDELYKVRRIDFSEISTLWVFVFAEISGRKLRLDQNISCGIIFDMFTELCPTLSNKPKVFVLQGLDKYGDDINSLDMDYCRTENVDIPLPCKPGVLLFMHTVRGRACSDNKTCLLKAFKKCMENKPENTELINLFRLIMSAIDSSKNAPPPFLFSTITNMTTLEQLPTQDPLFHYITAS